MLPRSYHVSGKRRVCIHQIKLPVWLNNLSQFSHRSHDQAHEQNNEMVKVVPLMKWMVSGPEISQMLNTREKNIIEDQFTHHHENTHSFENRFTRNITSFKEVSETEGYPFLEAENILITKARTPPPPRRGVEKPEGPSALQPTTEYIFLLLLSRKLY